MSGDSKRKINSKVLQEFKDLLAGELKAPVDPRLTEISSLEVFDAETIDPIIRAFYESEDPIHRRFGSILNAIYTQGLSTFVLTKDLADKLVKKDLHYQPTSCDTNSYKKLMSFALGREILKELRAPTRNDIGISGKAGLYELVHKKFLIPLHMLVGEAVCAARKENFIKWYDENNTEQVPVVTETPEILEERKRIREKLNERKNKTKT